MAETSNKTETIANTDEDKVTNQVTENLNDTNKLSENIDSTEVQNEENIKQSSYFYEIFFLKYKKPCFMKPIQN